MPVSFFPLIITVASAAIIVTSVRMYSNPSQHRKAVKWLVTGVLGIVGPPILSIVIGCVLWCGALLGYPSWQFVYSRWLDSTPDMVGVVSIVPMSFRQTESWYWLDKASNNGHLEATYALGYRIKHGLNVPNGIKDGIRGQQIINNAIAAGYDDSQVHHNYYSGRFRIRIPLQNGF